MNSFRFLQRGVEAELERQRELVAAGGTVEQETLHFDPRSGEPDLAALEGGSPRLPLLPRARPGPDRADRGDAARGPRGAAGAAGGADRALRRRWASSTRRRHRAGDRPRDRRLLRARPPRPRAGWRPKVVANWVTGELAAALRQADDEAGAAGSKVTPEALAALVGLVGEKKISHGSGKTVLAALVAEGGEPGGDRRARGPRPDGRRRRRAGGDRRRRDRGRPRRRRADPRRQRQGDRRDRRRRDAGDQGPRRRRRGQPPDPASSSEADPRARSEARATVTTL